MPEMFFDNFGAFVEMGGHGFYVWLSFGLTLLLILGNILYARLSRRRFFHQHALRQVRRARTIAIAVSTSPETQVEKVS